MLAVGTLAPEIKLLNQDGDLFDSTAELADGKWICVYFYPKDLTPACTEQGCLFRDLNKDFKALNCVVVGISKDTARLHKKFLDTHKFTFDLLADTNHQVIDTYEVFVEKSMFGRKYMGIARATYLINPDGKISAVWEKADASTNAASVLSKLQELQKNS